MMKKLYFVALTSFQFETASADGECPDINGRSISQGLHYVPGPNKCTLCICDNGQPKWCKAVLCSTPQDCKTFRLGNTCCEFICLDDTLTKHPDVFDAQHDFGLRLIAGAITVILFLSILSFMIHRLRQRKLRSRQNRQHCEDERSLASIGYIGGSMPYMGNTCYDVSVNFPLWKPPGSYFPRGEAPPPYDEAVAQSRNDSNRRIEATNVLHGNVLSSHTSNIESLIRNSSNSIFGNQPSTHNNNEMRFSQISRNSAPNEGISNNPTCSHGQFSFSDRDNAPESTSADVEPSIRTQHIVRTGNPKLGSVKITSSISLTGARALLSAVTRGQTGYTNRSTPNNFYVNSSNTSNRENASNESSSFNGTSSSLPSSSRHRTIPRNPTTDDMLKDNINYRIRKHDSSNSHRSISHQKLSEQVLLVAKEIINNTNNLRNNDAPIFASENSHKDRTNNHSRQPRNAHIKVSDYLQDKKNDMLKKSSTKSLDTLSEVVSSEPLLSRNSALPSGVDKPSCGCSYNCQPPLLTCEEQEDYYSECENCKSGGSSYYVEWSPCETMTLQRRGRGSRGVSGSNGCNVPPRAGATLPTNSHATDRLLNGSSENRESWFTSIPGSTSSEDD